MIGTIMLKPVKADEYSQAAKWCNETQQGIIVDKGLYYAVEEKPEPTQREKDLSELRSLESWFTWYDEQCSQYQRSLRLGTVFNKNIAELDAMAVENASRITELRKILTGTH